VCSLVKDKCELHPDDLLAQLEFQILAKTCTHLPILRTSVYAIRHAFLARVIMPLVITMPVIPATTASWLQLLWLGVFFLGIAGGVRESKSFFCDLSRCFPICAKLPRLGLTGVCSLLRHHEAATALPTPSLYCTHH
jgi:hypothetical protein